MRNTDKRINVNSHSALANEVIKYKRLGYQITYEKSGFEYVMAKGKNHAVVWITRS